MAVSLPKPAADGPDDGKQRRLSKAAVALALASGRTVKQAAAEAGVGQRTIFRWLRSPSFNRRVARYRAELVKTAAGQLADTLTKAIGTLRHLLADDSPTIRLRAADLLLSHAVKVGDQADVHQRLEELEKKLSEAHQPAGVR